MTATVRVLRTPDEGVALRPAWDELADSVDAGLFCRSTWCEPWWRQLGGGQLHVVTVEEGGRLVGLAPLHRRAFGPLRFYRFLGHGLGAVSGLLVAPGHVATARMIWEQVLSDRRGFVELLDHHAGAPGLDELAAVAGKAVVEPRELCPVIVAGGSFEHYLASRSKGLRRTLRKGDEALVEGGGMLTMEVAEPTPAVVEEVAAVYRAAEQVNPRLDVFAGRCGSFTRDLLATAAADGTLRLFVGRVQGRVVTVDLGFRTGTSIGLWAGRYDPADRAWSPGHLALRDIIASAVSEGVDVVDLLLGDAPYKRKWATGEYGTLTVTAAASPGVHRVGLALLRGGEAARGRQRDAGRGQRDAVDA